MSNNENFYGIYINNKVPKLKNNQNINKYKGYIKPKFKGKAYITENFEEKQELKHNKKYRKKGKHTIKYINEKNEIFFIDIEIKRHKFIWLFFILLFLLIIAVSQINKNNYITNYRFQETTDFDVDFEANRYVFNINFGDTNFQNVTLTNNSKDTEFIYPGSKGYFYIQISTIDGNKDMNYKMQIQDELNKPKFLKFEINGNTFDSMEDLAKSINGTIDKNTTKSLKINWIWEYENYNGDQIDTNDGKFIQNYKVLMRIVGNSKGG